MAAGTVGYTDTRGNRDYIGEIAGQIKRRVGEASDMAGKERAFAEEQAEAGGTSLDEAGIGRGYFFGRALGSRFGGDAIARTKGRFSKTPSAGIDPAGTAASRFRGGFDYNITNEISAINEAPLTGAVVTGLAGVESGLVAVSQSMMRIDNTLGGLERTQADTARSLMGLGYMMAMLRSQSQQAAGRASLRREERSLERGGGFAGGSIGGSSFGGAGGGRGMINVTPGGARGAGGGGGAAGFGSSSASFLTGNIGNMASRALGTSLSANRGMNSIVTAGTKGLNLAGYKAVSSGDIVGMMGTNSLYKKYGIDTSAIKVTDTAVGNSNSIANAAAKMFGLNPDQTKSLTTLVGGGEKAIVQSGGYMTDAMAAANKYGKLYTESDPAIRKILASQVLAEQFGKKPDKMAQEMMQAIYNLRDVRNVQLRGDKLGPGFKESFFSMQDDVYEAVAKKYGKNNAEQFMKLGLFSSDDLLLNGPEFGVRSNAVAESLMKNYDNMTYESLEQAVMMARVGDMKDAGYSSTRIVKELRKKMGNNADNLLLKYGDDVLSNSQVSKIIGKGSAKVGLRRALKLIPGIGLGLGIIFGIQRAMKGDFLGAGLEIGSGVLGLNPATSGLGLGIDGFLLARDMGAMPLNTGTPMVGLEGTLRGGKGGTDTNLAMLSNGESVLNQKATSSLGIGNIAALNLLGAGGLGAGLVMGMLEKKKDYTDLQGEGFVKGMNKLANTRTASLVNFDFSRNDSSQNMTHNIDQAFFTQLADTLAGANTQGTIINNVTNNNVSAPQGQASDDSGSSSGGFSDGGLDFVRIRYLSGLM